ncbi:hypothetical protein KSP40_PGU005172 [Platanthera guangdongensis]|uniref:Uncharacterized protein n=1 Tax=Platanthera guangdongensis TaxID=2320717 RepID=A0ABR2MTQ2_9ASPA
MRNSAGKAANGRTNVRRRRSGPTTTVARRHGTGHGTWPAHRARPWRQPSTARSAPAIRLAPTDHKVRSTGAGEGVAWPAMRGQARPAEKEALPDGVPGGVAAPCGRERTAAGHDLQASQWPGRLGPADRVRETEWGPTLPVGRENNLSGKGKADDEQKAGPGHLHEPIRPTQLGRRVHKIGGRRKRRRNCVKRRPAVVDSYSCRQMYLRSYPFSAKKESMPEKTRRNLRQAKHLAGAAIQMSRLLS